MNFFLHSYSIVKVHLGLSSHLSVRFESWSVWMDSNHRPRAYQARALTTWATDRFSRGSRSLSIHRFCGLIPIRFSDFRFSFQFPSPIGVGIEPYIWTSFRRLVSCNHQLRQFSTYDASHRCLKIGGDDGNRTHDPLLAGQVLSQLSYTPIGIFILQDWILTIEQQKTFLRS